MSQSERGGLLSWLGVTVRGILDRASEEMAEPHVVWMESAISRLKQGFDFSKAAAARRLEGVEREIVANILYRRFLERSWRDSQLTQREGELLAWLGGNLGLSQAALRTLSQQTAVGVFKRILVNAFADAHLDGRERQHLDAAAAASGHTVPSLMQSFLESEGENLARSLFAGVASDGQLTRDEWKRFRETVAWLGVPKDRMLQAIRQPAKQLVEHAIADARSDNEVTENEDRIIASLLENLIDDPEFASYEGDAGPGPRDSPECRGSRRHCLEGR